MEKIPMKFFRYSEWFEPAPFRVTTVYDATTELPDQVHCLFNQITCYCMYYWPGQPLSFRLLHNQWAVIFPQKATTTVCLGFCFHPYSMRKRQPKLSYNWRISWVWILYYTVCAEVRLLNCSGGRRVESNQLLPGPGSWGGSGEDLIRLNSSEFKNLASGRCVPRRDLDAPTPCLLQA